jgi:hypothetical protein
VHVDILTPRPYLREGRSWRRKGRGDQRPAVLLPSRACVSRRHRRGPCYPAGTVNRQLALHFALRPADNVEVGGLGGDIVARRAGRLARALRESCPRWLQEVLVVAQRPLPMAPATAHYTGGVLDVVDLPAEMRRPAPRDASTAA